MRINILLIIALISFHGQSLGIDPDTLFTGPSGDDLRDYFEIRDDHGVIRETGYLFSGLKQGSSAEYNQRGNLVKVSGYYNGKLDGTVLTLMEGGFVESEEHYKNGLRNGKRIVYRYGGVRKIVEEYKEGLLDGTVILFYDNGFKQEEASYHVGFRDGITKWYNQSEVVTIEQSYKKGLLDGPAVTYHFNGKVLSQGTYVNNKESGEWKEFDANGKHVKSTWYKSGKVTREETY